MTDELFDRRPREPLSDYAQRMLDLINDLVEAAMELVRQHERDSE